MGIGIGQVLGVVIAILFIITIFKGVRVVPQQQAWIVEKLGRFDRKLLPGLNFLIPFIEAVSYKHSLKEDAIDVSSQSAITKDNVTLRIDGILYVKIIDPVEASYGVNDPYYSVIQLAQTTMRSEIGKMTMDTTLQERDALNISIVNAINEAASAWGIQCMRYEIKDIEPPATVLKAMELQVAAERQKRAEILESEGERQSKINVAEADKQQAVLTSEAARIDQINRAEGEAQAILSVAEATAEGLRKVSEALGSQGGKDAASLKLAEQYIASFQHLAKTTNTLIIPANAADTSSMVAQAVSIFDNIKNANKFNG